MTHVWWELNEKGVFGSILVQRFLQAVNGVVGGRGHPACLVDVLADDPAVNTGHDLFLLFDLLLALADVAAVGLGLEQGDQVDSGDRQFLFMSTVGVVGGM